MQSVARARKIDIDLGQCLGRFQKFVFRDEVQGAGRAATGMYVAVHEDDEHPAAPQVARKTDF